MDTLESLRALRAQGVINAAEFVSLASEIAKAQAAAIGAAREQLSSLQASPVASPLALSESDALSASSGDAPAPSKRKQRPSPARSDFSLAGSDAFLVDEDGELLPPSCSSPAPAATPVSRRESVRSSNPPSSRRSLEQSLSDAEEEAAVAVPCWKAGDRVISATVGSWALLQLCESARQPTS